MASNCRHSVWLKRKREEQLGTDAYNDDEMDAMQQDELARQFAQSQQHRYGEEYHDDTRRLMTKRRTKNDVTVCSRKSR